MDAPLLIARLILAATFAIAGLVKLADLEGSRRAVEEFGVPRRLASTVGTLLPVAEIAVAAALVPEATARAGGIAALALLLTLSVGIARSETPDCHCFGQLHSAPAGPRALARNFALAALVGFVLVAGDS
jgi:uncharacterized membrane protein YphA (DoxX/SURF4 family)